MAGDSRPPLAGDSSPPLAGDSGPPLAGDSGPPLAGDSGPPLVDALGCSGLPGLSSGDHELELEFDGRTRRFHVHVPRSYDGSRPLPLVLNFHGFSANASIQSENTGLNRLADAEGFFTLHPEGWGGLLGSWNAGKCCGEAKYRNLDDVGLTRALVDHVQRLVCVDHQRIYATGMSNGGFMSYRLACEAADIFAAIAPVAGVMGVPLEGCSPGRAVSVLAFHGTRDRVIFYDGGGLAGPTPSAPQSVEHWASVNRCTDDPPFVSYDAGNSRCEVYRKCRNGAEVGLCTITGGGHHWPGDGRTPDSINATEEIWRFFSRHTLD